MSKQEAKLIWEGDSLEVLRGFPKAIRQEFGIEIYRLQLGERAHDCKPMKSISQGVYELRQRDARGWYRVIYLNKVNGTLFMLHSFVKKSAKTSKKDLAVATNRLKVVRARLLKEKNNAEKKE